MRNALMTASGRILKSRLTKHLLVLLILHNSVDIGLRLYPKILGQHFVNATKSQFHTGRNGIFVNVTNPPHINRMKANYYSMIYHNGYMWHHQTDQYGFRNDAERVTADVVFLGDSYVYGLGVEASETMPSVFKSLSGLTVKNMGTNGLTALSSAHLLDQYIEEFQPRLVIFVATVSDIIETSEEITNGELATLGPVIRVNEIPHGSIYPSGVLAPEELSLNSYFVLALKHFIFNLKTPPEIRVQRSIRYAMDESFIGWRANFTAIRWLHQICETHHAQLIIFPLVVDKGHERFLTIYQGLGKRENIPIIPLIVDKESPELLLTRNNDSHLSPLGNAKASRYLYSQLKEGGFLMGDPAVLN